MLLNQLVAGADVRGGHLFLRRESVLNHLKDPVEARQRKNQHHHAANAGRFDELLIGRGDIAQVLPVAFRFGVLLATNGHIQLGGGFTRQDLAQPLHQRGGQRSVHHKIGTGEAKHDAGLGAGSQAGINKQFPVVGTMNGQQKRHNGRRRNQFAHQPGRFIAVEKLVGYLQMAVAEHLRAECFFEMGVDIPDIPGFILPGQTQRQIRQHAVQELFPSAIGEEIFRQRTRNGTKASLGLGTEDK